MIKEADVHGDGNVNYNGKMSYIYKVNEPYIMMIAFYRIYRSIDGAQLVFSL